MSDENSSDASGEVDEIVARLQERERAHKRSVLIKTAALLIPAIVAIAVVWMYRETLLAPELDVEGGEKEVLAETNDPQCRELIATVTTIGEDFELYQPVVEKDIEAENQDAVEGVRKQLAEFRKRLDDAETASVKANLRFDESRSELNAWFKYVDNEFALLDNLAAERLVKLNPPLEEADAGAPEEAPKAVSKKTTEERLDGALLAADDAFENFRVWHTSSLHPCGAADEGEIGWTPEKALVPTKKSAAK